MEFELFFKALSSAPAEKIGLTIRFIFVLIEDVHLGSARCSLSESSGAERHLNQTTHRNVIPKRYTETSVLFGIANASKFSSSSLLPIETKKKTKINYFLIQYGLLIVFRDRSALSQNK
jgi:hypothetical protein